MTLGSVSARVTPTPDARVDGGDAASSTRTRGEAFIGRRVVAPGGAPPQALAHDLGSVPRAAAGRPMAARQVQAAPSGAGALRREAMPTSTALRRDAGEPRKDWTLMGMTLKRQSTGYQAVLGGLNTYHRAAEASGTPPTGDAAARKLEVGRQLQALAEPLHALGTLTESYLSGSSHGRKEALAQLGVQAGTERGQLESLRGQLARMDEWPADVNLADVRELVGSTTPAMPLAQACEALAGLRTSGLAAAEQRVVLDKMLAFPGLDHVSARQAIAGDMADTLVSQYAASGTPIRPETTGATFGDARLQGGLAKLGSGAINTVYKGLYNLPDGGTFAGVFKPFTGTGEVPAPGTQSGIPQQRPAMEMRNVAVHRIDSHLGLGVAPRAEIGLHQVGGEHRLGLVMSFAAGHSPLHTGDYTVRLEPAQAALLRSDADLVKHLGSAMHAQGVTLEGDLLKVVNSKEVETNETGRSQDTVITRQELDTVVAFDMRDPLLREKLTDLQWLDALCGQVDRHAHNYLVQTASDGAVTGVTGIDNDFAFGSALAHPNDINVGAHNRRTGGDPAVSAFKGCLMPDVISASTARKLLALTPGKLAELMGPGLSRAEVSAAQSRLVAIQQHVTGLRERGQVVGDPDDWASDTVGELLGVQPDSADRHAALAALPYSKANVVRMEAITEQAHDASYVSREALMVEQGARADAMRPIVYPTDFL